MTGTAPPASIGLILERVFTSRQPFTQSSDDVGGPPGVSAWPVVGQDETMAVVTVHQNLVSQRHTSRLEEVYRQSANDLFVMIAHGTWPAQDSKASSTSHGNPRVGDGLVRIDAHGLITYASPNATSAFRKLGIRDSVDGRQLSRLVTNQLDLNMPIDELCQQFCLDANQPSRYRNPQYRAVSSFVPLLDDQGQHFSALVLLRDITEIRRRDEQLISKDATIREIHHRVKKSADRGVPAPYAIATNEIRRRTSGAFASHAESRCDRLVHETLSQTMETTVDMDDLLNRQFTMAVEIAGSRPVSTRIQGSFGQLPGHLATPLALVVNELATNATEHGTGPDGGMISLLTKRVHTPGQPHPYLKVEVLDEGVVDGPAATAAIGSGLGTQIIRTLVESDLRGSISWERQLPDKYGAAGTRAVVLIPLDH